MVRGQALSGCRIEVDQQIAARVLGLRAADQAPYGRGREPRQFALPAATAPRVTTTSIASASLASAAKT